MYKLVAVKNADGGYTPKMKCSDTASKAIIPGKKMAWRVFDENGQAQCDILSMDDEKIEAGVPVTVINLDANALERRITLTPAAVKPLLVPHVLGGALAMELPTIAQKRAYIADQLMNKTWESELRPECPHVHYIDMTERVAQARESLYHRLHGGTL